MYDDFVFNQDVFLRTDYPVALDSQDAWSPPEETNLYFGQPLSFVCDFYDGAPLAKRLLEQRPGKTKLLDLGTASGSVPLTMRKAGMHSLGIDGLDAGKKGHIKPYMLLRNLGNCGGNREAFCWNVAPELVDCCDITKPFRIEDEAREIAQFDWIISTDCFEHLVTDRIPQLVDNVYEHLADDGWAIFEISTGSFHHMHQTVKPREWWIEQFSNKFVIDEDLSARDFGYVRSYVADNQIKYINDDTIDGFKILFWCRKR